MKAMDRKDIMTKQELEQLCSLYFEGSMDREEEKALRAILTQQVLQEADGIIAEAFFVMGIERATAKREKTPKSGRDMLLGAFRRIAIASVAATVMIGCVSAIWSFLASDVNTIDSGVYIVYCNGVRIDDPAEAKRIAMANYNEQMARMEEMQRIQNEVIEKMETGSTYAEQMFRKASDVLP